MPGPTLPAELVLTIIRLLLARHQRHTLLELCRACRSFYTLAMPLLFRRIDVHAGNLDAVANRLKWSRPWRRSLEALSPMFAELGAVSEVSVLLADVDSAGVETLRDAPSGLWNLQNLHFDCGGTLLHHAPLTAISWISSPLEEVVVTSANIATIQFILENLAKCPSSTEKCLLVFHPADPASLGCRRVVRGLRRSPGAVRRRRGWRVEMRGLVDSRAAGGWSLYQQSNYWEAYGHGASAVL
ncbi:hypothetical protein DFJ74DRAFT_311714 [Hyaloraphidium curvatum]|nr:hypothetical protein DFJ74DRAFT_311714 [Hyaloraphidium curvatum]